VASENCNRAVKLLGHDEAGEGVGQGEGTEGEQELGALAGGGGPAVRGADGEGDVLGAFIAAGVEPLGKDAGAHLASAGIEQHGEDGSAALLAIEPGDEGLFCFEDMGAGGDKRGTTIQVATDGGVELVAGAGSDVGKSDLHR
jgi:hypothetical protein